MTNIQLLQAQIAEKMAADPRPKCPRCGDGRCSWDKNNWNKETKQYGAWRSVCSPCQRRSSKGQPFVKRERCSICDFAPLWVGQLDVDHIDGNNRNNELTNLRVLCSNCHRLKSKESKEVLRFKYSGAVHINSTGRPTCDRCGERPCMKNYNIKKRVVWLKQCNRCLSTMDTPVMKRERCSTCNFVALHPCQLDLDHIDGDKGNKSPDNLRVICCNCHRLKSWLSKDGARDKYERGHRKVKEPKKPYFVTHKMNRHSGEHKIRAEDDSPSLFDHSKS